MEEKKVLTFEELMEGFSRIEKMQEENARGFARIEKLQEENARGFVELRELQKKNEEENAKGLAELRKLQEEDKADLRRSMKEMSKELGGIGRRNGKMAEEYFYNSLEKTKTLGGIHFDAVKRHISGSVPVGNGKTLDGEYDIALINDNSLGLVEVKYTVEKEDVENLVKEQVENFKRIFPVYADYKFYLGIGGLSFDKQAEDEAKKLGVGILKLNGDAVEINDKNLKVY